MLNPIEEIKNRLDIVDVIGGYLKLKMADVELKREQAEQEKDLAKAEVFKKQFHKKKRY